MTLYNHNTIGTQEKPLISNMVFKIVHQSLQNFEVKMYEDIKQKYSFESTQKRILEEAYKAVNIRSEKFDTPVVIPGYCNIYEVVKTDDGDIYLRVADGSFHELNETDQNYSTVACEILKRLK